MIIPELPHILYLIVDKQELMDEFENARPYQHIRQDRLAATTYRILAHVLHIPPLSGLLT
jgi:hypothetical protein